MNSSWAYRRRWLSSGDVCLMFGRRLGLML